MSSPWWLIPASLFLIVSYALFVRIITKPKSFAAHLKIGMVDILRDSIISNFIAFPIVWYSTNNLLNKESTGLYKYKFDKWINESVAWICNQIMHIESDYRTILEIYAAYIIVLLLPSLASAYIHFIGRGLPETGDYEETKHSPLIVFHGNGTVSRVIFLFRSFLNIFLIKTPIAFGALLMSVGILILSGHPAVETNFTWMILPFIFFAFVILAQIALIVTTYFNSISVYSDSRKLTELNQHLSSMKGIGRVRLP